MERPHPPRLWDPLMLVGAGLLLVSQARIHSFVPGFAAVRPALILALFGLVLWFFTRERERSLTRIMGDPMVKAAVFVLLWAVIGVPFSFSLGGSASFILESLTRTFLVFLLLTAAVRDLHDVRRLIGALAFGVAAFTVMAPVERYTGLGAGGYDPNDSAMFVASGIPVLVFFVLHGRRLWVRLGASLGILSSLGLLVDTQSRGGFLALLVVVGFMVFMLKGVKPAVRIGVVVVILLSFIPLTTSDFWDRMETITEWDDGYGEGGIGGRRNTWARGVAYTWQNPITGIGVDMFPRREGMARGELGAAAMWRAAHSTWIQVMAELGIPGFLAFLAMFVVGLRSLWIIQNSTWHPPPPMSLEELRSLGGLLLALLLGTITAATFLSHAYTGLIWTPLALIVGLRKVVPWGQLKDSGRRTGQIQGP